MSPRLPVCPHGHASCYQCAAENTRRIATLEARIAELTRAARRFPVMDDARYSVPWSCVEAFEAQALKNHSQTLQRLAERGGLASVELIAVIEGHGYRWVMDNAKMPEPQARARVFELLGLDATGQPSAEARIAELTRERDELQAAGERMVTPETHQSVQDRLRGEIHTLRAARAERDEAVGLLRDCDNRGCHFGTPCRVAAKMPPDDTTSARPCPPCRRRAFLARLAPAPEKETTP